MLEVAVGGAAILPLSCEPGIISSESIGSVLNGVVVVDAAACGFSSISTSLPNMSSIVPMSSADLLEMDAADWLILSRCGFARSSSPLEITIETSFGCIMVSLKMSEVSLKLRTSSAKFFCKEKG